MFNVSNMDHLNMNVKNLNESKKFYKKYFNLDVQESGVLHGTPWVIVGRSGIMFLALYETKEKIEISGVNHFGVHVKNLKKTLPVLQRDKVDFTTWDYDGPRGRSFAVYLRDPNGYEWELSEFFGGEGNHGKY